MNQRRRTFLKLCGAGTVVTLAGCSSSESAREGNAGDGNNGGPNTGFPTQQVAKLAADDGDSKDQFGNAVAVSGDGTTAVIGAFHDEDPNGSAPTGIHQEAGSAYVFDGTGGSWSQQAKLAADDGTGGDSFGFSVGVSDDGTTAIVGAWKEEPNGAKSGPRGAGSAYVFDSADGSWSQQAKLAADDGDSNDQFGRSVKLSSDGTTAIIGASADEDPNEGDGIYGAGSAYVFDSADGSWSQQAKLFGDSGSGRANYGRSVAISDDGSTAVVGAEGDTNPTGDRSGAAYVYDRAKGWSRQAKLTADTNKKLGLFGQSVAVSGDGTTALIASPGRDEVYVVDGAGGSWSQQTKFTVDRLKRADYKSFGVALALSGDGTAALVGAIEDMNVQEGKISGSVYVFTGSGSSWRRQTKLTAKDGDMNDLFGQRLSMSSDSTTAVVGASGDREPNGKFAGSAYVFE